MRERKEEEGKKGRNKAREGKDGVNEVRGRDREEKWREWPEEVGKEGTRAKEKECRGRMWLK